MRRVGGVGGGVGWGICGVLKRGIGGELVKREREGGVGGEARFLGTSFGERKRREGGGVMSLTETSNLLRGPHVLVH